MARYGTFQYGAEKYAAQASTQGLTWAVEIDWDRDLVHNGDNEALDRLHYMVIERGRENFLTQSGDGIEPIPPGTLTIKLYDPDGRYNPFNSDSDIYPNAQPGCNIVISVYDEDDSSTKYPVIMGYVSDVEYVSGETYNYAVIKAEDMLEWIRGNTFVGDLETSIKASDDTASAMKEILDGIDFPFSYDLNDTGDTFDYWWTYQGDDALKAIEDIYLSLGAKAFHDNDETLKFISPYRTDDSVLTITDADILREVRIPSPLRNLRNQVDYKVYGRTLQASGDIWNWEEVPYELAAGASVTLWANYAYDGIEVPASDVVTPVATTDYTMNAQADGGGADFTADLSIVISKFATVSKLVCTNDNAATGYITLLKLRGKALISEEVTRVQVEDTDSQDDYGVRRLLIDVPLMQDIGAAEDIADWLLDNMSIPRPLPRFTIAGEPDKQFGVDLFDIIGFTISDLGIDADVEIGYMRHENLDQQCQTILTTIYTEPTFSTTASKWQFPTIAGRSSILTDV